MLVRINQAIGHIKLEKLQPHHLMAFYDNLSEEGVRDNISFKAKVDITGLLKENKITRAELSRTSGVSPTTITAMCQNKNVSKNSAECIAKALNQ